MNQKIVVRNKISRKELFDNFLIILDEQNKDFITVKKQFKESGKKLTLVFDKTDRLIAVYKKINLLNVDFSYKRGIKANAEHFKNPEKALFLNEDSEIYLYEKEMRNLPEMVKLYAEIRKLTALMSEEAYKIYNGMLEYYSFIDTYIPKMAHYYGFMKANEILAEVITDYSQDDYLNNLYKKRLSEYLEIKL